jgi:GrpB-like predicted nucleotidyltransferase (UPF0157 family)
VRVVPSDDEWPAAFAQERHCLCKRIGHLVLDIQHVGSTAVPGLAAKPIIDFTVAVPDSSDEASYVPALEAAGYVLRIREPDWYEHRLLRGQEPPVNLHVFPPGCEEVERMRVFRDHLRTNEADRELYARTKRELAVGEWKYVQDYANAKTAIVQEIMRRAEASS